MTALKVLSVGTQGFTDKLMKNIVLSGKRVGFTDKVFYIRVFRIL